MRKIEIREKIAPYSRTPGTACFVPCSNWILSAFPTMLKVGGLPDIPIGAMGPVKDFLVQMDLERDCVWISGLSQEGPYRLQIEAVDGYLWLALCRAPKGGLVVKGNCLQAKEKLLLAKGGKTSQHRAYERLSLGNWKAQDWDLIQRRNDLREIIPSLFLLGQKMPLDEEVQERWILNHSFSGILLPCLESGRPPDPATLLQSAYGSIRSHLIQEEGTQIRILPGIREYPLGRSHLCASFGAVHLEWSQGLIRKMLINPNVHCELQFSWQKEVASFRFCGKRMNVHSTLSLTPRTQVLLDCFQR